MNSSFDSGLQDSLEQLNTIGAALSKERDTDRLLESILLAAMAVTHADGGTLYRLTDDHQALRFAILRNNSLRLALGGTTGQAIDLPPVALGDEDGQPLDSTVAAYAAIHDRPVNIVDAYSEAGFDFSGTRAFDARTGYRSQSFLAVPMKNHDNHLIGVLQLINAKDPASRVTQAFSQEAQRLVESLASQAAMALTNRILVSQMEDLFESFIGMINHAIDEKSPHTGGHCQRVPELTMMLADAVHETTEGPFADFILRERDRYELKIAGLLHDCGKITTPVHVVEKATKLQTLYDRIGLVDTRFELLKRDAEIASLRRQLDLRPVANPAAEAALQADLNQETGRIEGDRVFLNAINIGAESMAETDRQRVFSIGAGRSWRGSDGVPVGALSADEMENLSIRKGTLTPAERDIINHHIVGTINMLEQLPWPRHLRHVAEYAGGHHERMDGTGYPRGLTREEMSPQARMMGIADIFEALTAPDRPYKKAMKLSQALAIMREMASSGHIDPDLFEVFIKQGVYRRYAQRFMDADQIDEVDQARLLE